MRAEPAEVDVEALLCARATAAAGVRRSRRGVSRVTKRQKR